MGNSRVLFTILLAIIWCLKMMKLVDYFKEELKQYCSDNEYNYQKLLRMPRCGNEEYLLIQHVDFDKAPQFIDDSEPAETVLEVRRLPNGKVTFLKGKNADMYLI